MKVRSPVLQAVEPLTPFDLQLAATLCRLASEDRPWIASVVSLLSCAVREGSTCLLLGPKLVSRLDPPLADPGEPSLSRLRRDLEASTLVGGPDAYTPLVLTPEGRLYFRTYWESEMRLAERVVRRLPDVGEALPEEEHLQRLLEPLFPEATATQTAAARSVLTQKLTILSGRPGTGKTTLVVRMLALCIQEAIDAGRRMPRIALLAPTGKAAARLSEAVRTQRERLSVPDNVREAITGEASTVHRALANAHTAGRHALPLSKADLVVIDEASMVGLQLMTRVCEAVDSEARLVLLGDHRQLSSVQAGCVFSELCSGLRAPTEAAQLSFFSENHSPPEGHRPVVLELEHSYRYAAGSDLGRLSEAIVRGSFTQVERLLANRSDDVRWIDPGRTGRLPDALKETMANHWRDLIVCRTPSEAFEVLQRLQVLCAQRRGRFGAEGLNAWILAQAQTEPAARPAQAVRPILITRNDYEANLFNGDLGLLWRDPSTETDTAIFREGREGFRRFPESHLPEHESAFAMTIHKSQGSEFDRVVVVLPDDETSPTVTRELLYTGVTRARIAITLCATRETLRRAVEQPSRRTSGLAEAIGHLRKRSPNPSREGRRKGR